MLLLILLRHCTSPVTDPRTISIFKTRLFAQVTRPQRDLAFTDVLDIFYLLDLGLSTEAVRVIVYQEEEVGTSDRGHCDVLKAARTIYKSLC